MAAALYVLMLRRGVTRWLAALAVAPVLLDAYQLNAEQTIMPDVLFEALLVAGIVLLLWQPRPVLALVILGGLALGASAPVRQVGEALIVPALIYVLACAQGWRTRLLHGAVLTVCFALPIVGYMSYSAVILHYGFELSNMGDAYLYGRTAHAADCATLKIPADERPLCPSASVSASLGVDGLVNANNAPRVLYQPVDIQLGLLINTLPMQRQLAYSVLRQQPMRVAGDIAKDSVKIFALTRNTAEGDTGISRWQFQTSYPYFPPGITHYGGNSASTGLRPGRRRRVRADQPEGRHRAAGLPAARRIHAGTGVPALPAGRYRRDLHLPPAPRSGARPGLPADHRERGRRAARRGPVRVLLALPAARPGHAARRGRVRRHRGGPAYPGAPPAGAPRGRPAEPAGELAVARSEQVPS